MASQSKMVLRDGAPVLERWTVDERAIEETILWARSGLVNSLLVRELEEMEEFFPIFISTIAQGSEIINCRTCEGLLVWRDGLECIECGELYNPPHSAKLAYIGVIPSFIGRIDERGKPFEGECRPVMRYMLDRMRRGQEREKEILERYIRIQPDGDVYFFPEVRCIYPDNWNRNQPATYFHRDYFSAINLPATHTSQESSGEFYHLCIYREWPRVTLRTTLQQRIVPRIITDLMLADLQSCQELNNVLARLGTSFHDVYNWIGHGEQSMRFKREYERVTAL